MRKLMPLLLGLACLAARPALAQDAKTDDGKTAAAAAAKDEGKGPETIVLDKTNKMAPVKFDHAAHQKKFECKECHGGDTPLFAQKKSDTGMKMADMYAGKACGACHNGKKAFAAKAGCMKCHKKP